MFKEKIRRYVRTEYGYILENTTGGHGDIIKKLVDGDKHYEFEYGKIVKSSNTLVAIIEVGDYINGEKIIEIQVPEVEIISPDDYTADEQITVCIFKCGKGAYYRHIKEEEITSILTHEQYYQNAYKK
jgi:hypothetical protein|nr:MAG TPA: hypothetical protein [Caudoviricetes sp.]